MQVIAFYAEIQQLLKLRMQLNSKELRVDLLKLISFKGSIAASFSDLHLLFQSEP